jgi:hypothetical protein
MKPSTCIRLVLPPNKVIQSNTPSQNANHLNITQPIILGQNNISSVQPINGVPSKISPTNAHLIITSPAATFGLQKSFTIQKTNNLPSVAPVSSTYMNSTLPYVNAQSVNSHNVKPVLTTDNSK